MGRVDRREAARELLCEKGHLVRLEQERDFRHWCVPSRSGGTGAEHKLPYSGDSCTCKDHEYRGSTCVHMIAVAIVKIERARWEEAKLARRERGSSRRSPGRPHHDREELEQLAERLGL
jgi:hypothetical protein